MFDAFLDSKVWPVLEAVATTLIALYAVRQFREAREIADRTIVETRRIGEAQVRAYLSCEGGRYLFQKINETENGLYITASIKNFGQSPALNVRLKGFLGAFMPAEIKEAGGLVLLVGSIPASGHTEVTFIFSPKETGAGLWTSLWEQSYPVTFAAELFWQDVFGISNSTLIELAQGGTPPVPPQRRGQFVGGMSVLNHAEVSDDTERGNLHDA